MWPEIQTEFYGYLLDSAGFPAFVLRPDALIKEIYFAPAGQIYFLPSDHEPAGGDPFAISWKLRVQVRQANSSGDILFEQSWTNTITVNEWEVNAITGRQDLVDYDTASTLETFNVGGKTINPADVLDYLGHGATQEILFAQQTLSHQRGDLFYQGLHVSGSFVSAPYLLMLGSKPFAPRELWFGITIEDTDSPELFTGARLNQGGYLPLEATPTATVHQAGQIFYSLQKTQLVEDNLSHEFGLYRASLDGGVAGQNHVFPTGPFGSNGGGLFTAPGGLFFEADRRGTQLFMASALEFAASPDWGNQWSPPLSDPPQGTAFCPLIGEGLASFTANPSAIYFQRTLNRLSWDVPLRTLSGAGSGKWLPRILFQQDDGAIVLANGIDWGQQTSNGGETWDEWPIAAIWDYAQYWFPSLCYDRQSGALYAFARKRGTTEIYFRRTFSSADVLTWSNPVFVGSLERTSPLEVFAFIIPTTKELIVTNGVDWGRIREDAGGHWDNW